MTLCMPIQSSMTEWTAPVTKKANFLLTVRAFPSPFVSAELLGSTLLSALLQSERVRIDAISHP